MIYSDCLKLEDLVLVESLWQKSLQATWTKEMIKKSFENPLIYTRVIRFKDEVSLQNTQNITCIAFLMGSFLEEAELYALVVREDFQRQGIGERLLQEFLKFLKSQKISSLFLEVSEANLKALAFYEKQGFEKICVRPSYYQKKQENGKICSLDAIILKKKI